MNGQGTSGNIGPDRSQEGHYLSDAVACLDWQEGIADDRLSNAYARFGQHVVDTIGNHYPWERIGAVAVETFRCDDGLVYFVGADHGPVKIGFTTKPLCRLASMQLGSPLMLGFLAVVRGPIKVEKAYHARFAAHRSHGEWFHRHPDIIAEIDRLKQLSPADGNLRGATKREVSSNG